MDKEMMKILKPLNDDIITILGALERNNYRQGLCIIVFSCEILSLKNLINFYVINSTYL